ncbi:Serine/threonine-protein kinase Rio1 [Trichodelitschia bisporula]|uniref:Serine/threonine-protein kinase RIO1 n=1 Tax=Trichodelitschia bisporula TaxID=703511 RepID=A0A6G1HQ00_9PEZI|nr:Serine/threonine-protein kinase Rio1 [Trichodelitschia bisporula]
MPHPAQIAAAAAPAFIDKSVHFAETDNVQTVPRNNKTHDSHDDTSDSNTDYDDLFDDPDEEDFTGDPNDLTKAYNRARRLADPSVPDEYKPRTNPQKPSANTTAALDDQIASLAKHAGKIKIYESGPSSDRTRDKDKSDRATSEQVLDPRTRMLLLQMINRGVVSEINGCISTGKEANVYHAVTLPDDDMDHPPLHRAIKVYKTAILEFKDRSKYIIGEHRFRHGYNKRSNRAMVKVWADKEMRNLKRLHGAGIPCPEPLYLRLHVLVMSFLGDKKGYPAPRLKDVVFEDDSRWRGVYLSALGWMRRMHQVCQLVHGDLSEYNMMYWKDKVYIIDVSQSVEHDHPKSLEFLRMDIKNVTDFFRRKGVDVLSEREVYAFITGEGSASEPDMLAKLEGLLAERAALDEAGAERASVEDEVFRQQYIPQNLEQVYDIERDTLEASAGGLVYQDLLAVGGDEKEEEETDSDESGSEEWEEREDGPPRGKRFIDKEEKKAHKHAVKEEKREKRKVKIPKHVKKQLVSGSARTKKR